ncbi:MAG: class I SAM-dependent methyltransferase, partial [Promethearchaeota archaeon]
AHDLEFPPNTFDGLISVYTLFHIPRKDHSQIIQNFYEVLKPGGILLINSGVSESEGMSTFFGVPMFWSNYTPDKLLQLVKKTGFSILFEDVLQRGGEYQYWIFARK